MAKVSSDYPIGKSSEYISNVKGLFNYSIDSRNSMLMNNPLERRYRDYYESYSMVDAPDIGEKYILPNPKRKQKSFLDSVGGLVGYTYADGYLNTNNYKVISRFEEIEKHQGYLRYRVPYLYNVDLHVDINREQFDYSFLDRLYVYYTQEREMNIYGNSSTYREFNPKRHVVNQYNPTQTYVEPKSTNKWYSTNQETFYPDGDSIDTQSYSQDNLGFVEIIPSNLSLNTRTHGLYDERTEDDDNNELKIGEGSINNNRPSNDLIDDLRKFNNNPNGLINKTNNLFRQGKINSMINRFYLPNQGISEIQTAVNGEYGVSRGRNLLKKNSSSVSNGYEDPYCRVWTSHYQYSKYKNAIRPFIENGSVVTPADFDNKTGKGFRPFKGSSVRDMSVIDGSNGLPTIAPKTDEDIKKCMFSIENLAWRDIYFNTEVVGRGAGIKRGIDKVLSKEQQGPNGGRIMWFPPYNLKFTENVGVNWNGNSFIGRGEQIYTYVNTDRSGTLDFTLLIDHPSILDRYSVNKDLPTIENDEEILRFFAGCAPLPIDDKVTKTKTETKERPVSVEPSVDPKPEEIIVDLHKRIYAFYPNNFSGKDYVDTDPNRAITYLLSGGNGTGYEGGNGSSCSPIDGCIGVDVKTSKNKNGGINTWYYEVDDFKKDEVLKTKTTYDGTTNYKDTKCFGLNNGTLINILTGGTSESKKAKEILRISEDLSNEEISNDIIPFSVIGMLREQFEIDKGDNQFINALDVAEEVKIRCVGFASKHGDKIPKGNYTLAYNRAKLLQEFLIKESKFDREWFSEPTVEGFNVEVGNDSVSSIEAKLGRHAAVFIDLTYKYMKQPEVEKSETDNLVHVENNAYQLSVDITRELMNTNYENARNTVLATSKNIQKFDDARTIGNKIITTTVTEEEFEPEYDTEYYYFKRIGIEDDMVKSLITNKVKYFDPAFHSITPEGFNSRLTFLHQCTRQGPTVAASENGAVGAGNLAFGRPPVCVLRIGDFYNTRIIIDSVSINYDVGTGVQWDMNTEGIGMQPMFANVTIGFKFLGGSDLSGPISRLQNAVSYNFYANTSVYDRHSDYRPGYIAADKYDDVDMWEASFNPKTKKENSSSATSEITEK